MSAKGVMSLRGVSVFGLAAEGGVLAIMRSTIPCRCRSNASGLATLDRYVPLPSRIPPGT